MAFCFPSTFLSQNRGERRKFVDNWGRWWYTKCKILDRRGLDTEKIPKLQKESLLCNRKKDCFLLPLF